MLCVLDRHLTARAYHFLWQRFTLPSSDNGGDTGKYAADNRPLRGGKSSGFEGGVRTSAIIAGGVVPASARGMRRDGMVHLADFMATFAHLAGYVARDDFAISIRWVGYIRIRDSHAVNALAWTRLVRGHTFKYVYNCDSITRGRIPIPSCVAFVCVRGGGGKKKHPTGAGRPR